MQVVPAHAEVPERRLQRADEDPPRLTRIFKLFVGILQTFMAFQNTNVKYFNASDAAIEIFQRNPRLLMCRRSVDRVFLKAVELLHGFGGTKQKKEAALGTAGTW